MGREIERKFLVIPNAWRPDGLEGTRFVQGYLSMDPERVVRVRIEGDEGRLTVKGIRRHVSRLEYEYEIPVEDAHALHALCIPPLVEKVRYRIAYAGRTWEVDEFAGLNEGLVLAEIELASETDALDLPPWVGREVSADDRYANTSLARHPFTSWSSSPA